MEVDALPCGGRKKLGREMIPSLGVGSEPIKKRCFGDGGDCPHGLEVVCGLNEEEQANRMAAGIVHRVDQTEKERDELGSRINAGSPYDLAGTAASDLPPRGSSLGTVTVIAKNAITTMSRLNSSATPAANRMSILLVFPRNTSDRNGTRLASPRRSAVNSAADIATPKAEPREDAIL